MLQKIKDNLKKAMKLEVMLRKQHRFVGIDVDIIIAQKTVSRAIISMIPSLGLKPSETTDNDIIKLLKKYIRQQKERLLYTHKIITEKDIIDITPSDLKELINAKILESKFDSLEINIAQTYLPAQPTAFEVTNWISENINFSDYKNKMQAMGMIMKHFKGAEGGFIKEILVKYK